MSIKYFPSSLKLTRDTKSNIISTSPAVNTLAYATDTERFYVYDGSDWDAEFLTITENDTRYLKLDGSNANTTIDIQRQALRLGGATNIVQQIIKGNVSQTANLTEWQNSSGTNLVEIDSAGKVGIGIDPTVPLDLITDGAGSLRLRTAGVTKYWDFFSAHIGTNPDLVFKVGEIGVGSTEVARFNNLGYFNLGSSANPGARLQINTGTSTVIGQIVKAAASQTANLTEWQNSSGSVITKIENSGAIVVGTLTGNALSSQIVSSRSYANTSGVQAGNYALFYSTPSASSNNSLYGLFNVAQFTGSNNSTGSVRSFLGSAVNNSTGTLSGLYGGFVQARHINAGTTSSMYGLGSQIEINNASGTVWSAYIFYGINSYISGAVSNMYGLYIPSLTQGSISNYAIYTNAGTVHVGDKIEFTQIDGNEAIDSLADGYMDYLATTAHRFNAPITVPSYERHIQIPVQAVGNPANQPTAIDAGTAGGYQFASSGVQEELHFQWEVPDDWDGTDIKLEIDWLPDSGTKTSPAAVRWVFEYRFIAPGESILQGTQATQSISDTATVAQYITIHSPVTLPFNDANQPITKQDHLYVRCYRDTTVANNFTGTVVATAFEVIYNSNTLPTNN